MDTNLNTKNYEVFNEFVTKIDSLKNESQLISEINAFCTSLDTISLVNHMLTSLITDKYYAPNNSVHNKITLFTSLRYEFSVIHNPTKGLEIEQLYLYSYTNDVFLCPLINVPDSKYSVYEQNNLLHPDVLTRNAKLDLKKEETFSKNKAIYLRKFKDVLKLDESKPFLILMIASREATTSYTWEYSAKTLKPTRIALADINIARLATTAKILGSIGDDNSKPLLKKLCNHQAHSVRWDAVRSLICVDFKEGVKMLKQMINDDHHEVRTAAVRSLEILNL